MEFKAITTQEEFDAAIKDRLARERDTVKKQYEGFISPDDLKKQTDPLNDKITEITKQLNDEKALHVKTSDDLSVANAKIKTLETDALKVKITAELGLPHSLASRLNGEKEEDIRKDAESMKKLFGSRSEPPLGDPESGKNTDEHTEGMKKLISSIKGE